MTREEAIENLKFLLECDYVDSFEDAENEALDMAISALSADITECARAIKEYCKDRMKKPLWCDDCPLYEKVCFPHDNMPIPCKWDLPEGEKGGEI